MWNFAQVADITDADLLSMTAINLTGTIAIIREEAARMATRGSGSIVTLSSAIAASITWLASGNASYINGIELVANGGGFG